MAQVTTRGNPGKELNSLWLEEVGEARDHTGTTALTWGGSSG
jgi:hypothetical protein